MAKRGLGYGSEDHLLRYRTERPDFLDRAIKDEIGLPEANLDWIYPPNDTSTGGAKEPEGMKFLKAEEAILAMWRDFWPQTGKQPTWDAVAKLTSLRQSEWLLFEAKANHPEFCSPPSGASGGGRKKIEAAIGRVKKHLGVHWNFDWLGTYYQYVNRLACLYFLSQIAKVPARLVFVYFYGDSFPDGRPCPSSRAEWKELIRACHLTLGLAEKHPLNGQIHEVFLPAFGRQ
jgi:hypothetical protein